MSAITPLRGDVRAMAYSPSRNRRKEEELRYQEALSLTSRLSHIETQPSPHPPLIMDKVKLQPPEIKPLLEEAWLSLEAKRQILKGKLREIAQISFLLSDLKIEAEDLQHVVTKLEMDFTKVTRVAPGASGQAKTLALKVVRKKAEKMSIEELDEWIEKLEEEQEKGGEGDE